MLKSLHLCVLLFLVRYLHGLKECSDCIPFKDCAKANGVAITSRTPENEEKFKNAFCDNKKSGIPKVCCSDFDDAFDEVENHPNVHLLPDSCGDIDGKRIYGGKTASLYEYPWMTLLSYRTRIGLQFQCGGTIINSRYILTAAHCVKNKQLAGVRIGEYDIRYQTDCQGEGAQYVCESHIQDVLVEEVIIHEHYEKIPYFVNDIALLRLKKPINFSFKNAAPICLPVSYSARTASIDGLKATVAGWGLTENNQESSVLLKVDIPVLSSSQCRSAYNKDKVDNELCAGTLHKDSCDGDSGGPLMLERLYKETYRIIQYGIVSRGPMHCGSENPGIYTDVTKFITWILDKIRE